MPRVYFFGNITPYLAKLVSIFFFAFCFVLILFLFNPIRLGSALGSILLFRSFSGSQLFISVLIESV